MRSAIAAIHTEPSRLYPPHSPRISPRPRETRTPLPTPSRPAARPRQLTSPTASEYLRARQRRRLPLQWCTKCTHQASHIALRQHCTPVAHPSVALRLHSPQPPLFARTPPMLMPRGASHTHRHPLHTNPMRAMPTTHTWRSASKRSTRPHSQLRLTRTPPCPAPCDPTIDLSASPASRPPGRHPLIDDAADA